MAWCIQSFGREEMLQIAIEEWAGCSPIYTKRMQKALRLRGRRRHHDLQGPAVRHRCAAAVHGLPLHRPRSLARRVPPRPLRRAARRRTDGPGLRHRDVPRHRGPHLRRHRGRHQSASPGAARFTGRRASPPTATRTARGRSSSTRPIRRLYRIPALDVIAATRAATWHCPDRPRRRRGQPTTPDRCSPTSTSAPSRIRRWCASPTRCACRCTC